MEQQIESVPSILDAEEEQIGTHTLQMLEDIGLGPAHQQSFWEGVVTNAHFHNEWMAPLYIRWLIRRGHLPGLWDACVRSWELDTRTLTLLRDSVSEDEWQRMLPGLAWMSCKRQLLISPALQREILSAPAQRFLSAWGYGSRTRLAYPEWNALREAFAACDPAVQETAAGLAGSWEGDPSELLAAAQEICAG